MKRNRWFSAIAVVLVSALFGLALSEASQAKPPLLGAKEFSPVGRGFGSVRPKQIDNGGVASGWVHNIHWRRWGKKVAFGVGLGHEYRPSGGYFEKHVKVRLRASRIGYCGDSNWPAYTRLKARSQRKPGGKRYTGWYLWNGAPTICHH